MNRIRELRKKQNMTQKELAKHLQIADSTLSYWEIGKYEPDNEALMKLSRFFKVPIDYILDGDFTKWDISGEIVHNPDVDATHLNGVTLSVSEPETIYSITGEYENPIEPKTVGRALCVPDESSLSDKEKLIDYIKLFNRPEFKGLAQDELDLLAEYAMFIKSRRK
ncbi:MAG: helix-turn-helix domain-containing protein [Oscillospiraceae bacterium]|jgi:transcriptional regulator with XRE-family HTH domain|nr:helix-turn-helix domain-containing protein [Oscillospiraceae bacterium]